MSRSCSPCSSAAALRCTGRSVYRDVPLFSEDVWYRRFGEMLVDGHARPTARIYPAISQRLQLAIGSVISGDKTPEDALDEAWRVVTEEYARQTASRSAIVRTGVDPIAWLPLALSVLFPIAIFARGRRADAAAIRWVLPALALVTMILVYPMLDLLRLIASLRREIEARWLSLPSGLLEPAPPGEWWGPLRDITPTLKFFRR